MKINPITTMKSNVNFQRKLRTDEKPQYTKALHDALDYLDVKNLSMIVHGSSFPAGDRDTKIGSPYSKGADKFVDFLQLHGFNAVQLGPGGTISKGDSSPYVSKVFAKNEMFVDLEKLKDDGLLSQKTYEETTVKSKKSNKNYGYTDFYAAFSNYDVAMDEAYKTFKTKVQNKDEKSLKLNEEFEKFKKGSAKWLEQDGLYKVLSNYYGTSDFLKWENKTDKNLIEDLKHNDEHAIERYAKIKSRYGEEIEKNNFSQFLADKQMKENNEHRKNIGFNYIGDLLVGFSSSDVWANKDAFLQDWKLGCPYGGAGNGPQTWGIPILDPKKMFNNDGSLGDAGQLLKDKVAYSLKNYDNVRIDHALGLVDPYIYKENSVVKAPDGTVQRDKLVGNNVSQLKGLDPDGNYKKILEQIVLPTFKEYGVDKQQAVWEDLCSETGTFNEIYHGKENLPGITQTEWKRVENSPKENWSLVGSHDSKPAQEMVKDNNLKNSDSWNVDYLSGFLNPDPIKGKERQEYKEKIVNNPIELIKAKFTELFRGTKNLQMMFVDFFGIDKVYNYGGQDKPTNWRLRVGNDFEDVYHKSLENNDGYALNMPEILAQAVRAKAGMEVAKTADRDKAQSDVVRKQLDEKLNPLLNQLDNFKEVLKEKELV